MALLQETLPGLYNGVSQQPPTLRPKDQAEVQENAVGSLVRGLLKRPPAEFFSTFNLPGSDPIYVHKIERDSDEWYVVMFTGDATDPIQVYDVNNGDLKTVKYGHLDASLNFTEDTAVKDYLTSGSAVPQDKIRATTVVDYTIVVNSAVTPAMTSNTTGDSNIQSVDSYADLDTASNAGAGTKYRVLRSQYGDYVYYYVESDGDRWNEVPGYGVHTDYDPATMPHRLVRMSDGSFVFADIDWPSRPVGDERSAPTASFVGDSIQNMCFFQNRMVFISKTNVVMSRTKDYFNLWPETSLEVLGTDPVDIGAATNEVTIFREGLPFNKQLLLRADNHQFTLSGGSGGGVSPKNVVLDQTTRFTTIRNAQSVSAGSNLYFCCPNQNYVTLREYFVQPDSLVEDAADVTLHVPNYIPNGERVELTSVPQMDYIFCYTSGDIYSLYVYKFLWNNDKKAQSAWSRWTFANPVIGVTTFQNILLVLLDVSGTTVACGLYLNYSPAELTYLDKVQYAEGTYNSTNDETEFDLGFADPDTDFTVVDPDNMIALSSAYKNSDESIVRVSGDKTGKSYYYGQKYQMLYQFSPWYLKSNQGTTQKGKLKIRSLQLSFFDTGFFELHITPQYRDTITHTFNGLRLNTTILEGNTLHNETLRFMVLGESDKTKIELKNSTHLPSVIQEATFEGFYTSRAKNFS